VILSIIAIVIVKSVNRRIMMDPKDFRDTTSGRLVKTVENAWAFVPNPLPPEIEYDSKLSLLLSEADISLGDLSGTGRRLSLIS
jgi:hypothetical protein